MKKARAQERTQRGVASLFLGGFASRGAWSNTTGRKPTRRRVCRRLPTAAAVRSCTRVCVCVGACEVHGQMTRFPVWLARCSLQTPSARTHALRGFVFFVEVFTPPSPRGGGGGGRGGRRRRRARREEEAQGSPWAAAAAPEQSAEGAERRARERVALERSTFASGEEAHDFYQNCHFCHHPEECSSPPLKFSAMAAGGAGRRAAGRWPAACGLDHKGCC